MNWKKHSNIWLAVCLLVMTLAAPAGAVTHYVFEGQSIQAAIDDANDGDEIEVAPGTYDEAINFNGKAVRLYSSGGPEVTTIDGDGAYHVVQCVSGEDANTILEGFTITGGDANSSSPDDCGGGMYNSGSSPTVTNCTFSVNTANYGGGMFNYLSSSPTVTNCSFTSNEATYNGGGMWNGGSSSPTLTNCTFSVNTANYGGGMFNYLSSSPTVTNCSFTSNEATYNGGGMFNQGSSPTVTNCTFSGNTADAGGGMYNWSNSSPTVTNCSFWSNATSGGGGGMRNAYSSNPTVTNCTFESNTASTHGGGMVNVLSSSPTITNCTFSGNTASVHGGGIINSVGCSPTIVNCIFSSNSAQNGGGVFNNDNSHPIVTNCNFLYNSASVAGGGMRNENNSNPIVTNCIFWEDYAPDEISNDSSSPVVTYCDVKMPSGTYPGIGNINADPNFSGAIIMGRPECSNYLSSSASPCADAGDSNAPNLPGVDMEGKPRIIDGDVDGNSTVDIGAYELQPCVKNVTRNRWYQLIQHSVEDACENDRIEVPPGTYYESVDFMNAPNNFILTSTDPNDPNIVEQTIIDAKFGGHVINFWSQGPSCIVAGFTLTIGGNILMVPGFGYGIGSYGQTTSPTINNCVITNTRGVSFDNGSPVIRGCTIKENYGGIKVLNNAIIEDCIIANNFAIEGQGLYCAVETGWGNTILRRCVVSGNLCEYTAISCGGNTTLEDCDIFHNTGMMGAVWSSGSPPAGKMSGCTISNNKGGGINGWAGPIENCIITDNVGYRDDLPTWTGGGVNLCTGSISGCVIRGNEAMYGGGLARCSGSIANSVIVANRALLGGGGLSDCDGAISNCTILGNRAWGDPCSPYQGLGGGLYDCNVAIANCIIRQNWAQTAGDQLYSCSDPNYSCIQDWSGGGTGNITADPCFVYAGYWADVNDANIVLEPNEPNAVWVDGFYRLDRNSPCIDAGDNSSVPGGITTDLSGLPRFIDDLCTFDSGNGTAPVVDMGAYEFLPADIDNSGSVDLRDFSEFALHWAETGCGRCGGANLTCDGDVDWNDLRVLTDWWLAGTEP